MYIISPSSFLSQLLISISLCGFAFLLAGPFSPSQNRSLCFFFSFRIRIHDILLCLLQFPFPYHNFNVTHFLFITTSLYHFLSFLDMISLYLLVPYIYFESFALVSFHSWRPFLAKPTIPLSFFLSFPIHQSFLIFISQQVFMILFIQHYLNLRLNLYHILIFISSHKYIGIIYIISLGSQGYSAFKSRKSGILSPLSYAHICPITVSICRAGCVYPQEPRTAYGNRH